VTCHPCQIQCKRFGKHRNGLQRFRCNQCRKTFTEEHERPQDEMRLPVDRAVSVLQLLLEGMSVRSAERITGNRRVRTRATFVELGPLAAVSGG
jgi:transposase-like protein